MAHSGFFLTISEHCMKKGTENTLDPISFLKSTENINPSYKTSKLDKPYQRSSEDQNLEQRLIWP